jgi:hypothetical protein
MAKKTAVEWFIEQLEGTDSKIARAIGLKKYNQIVQQAKAMEKEQIIKANRLGRCNDCPFMYTGEDAEQYYNETFKNK